MKKFSFGILTALVLVSFCACSKDAENSETRFLLDTMVTLSAQCSDKVLSSAFDECERYEKLFSATVKSSDVYKLNSSTDNDGLVKISKDTREILKRSVYYSEKTGGKFDITVYPVSSLWNFKNETVPERDEIAQALRRVGYDSIDIEDGGAKLNGAMVDLGGIAKGYITDRLLDFFKAKSVKSGIINLGGNVLVFGDKEYRVGIKKPFSEENECIAFLNLKNKSAVTSGIYERCFYKDGKLYHHIIDPETGYPAESDLVSATVISDSSFDADALSTCSVLLGGIKAKELIESTKNTEAVFIDKSGNISYTSGLKKEKNDFYIK